MMVDACFGVVDPDRARCCVEALDGALSREAAAALVRCEPWRVVCRCGRRWVVRVTAQAGDARESLAEGAR